MQRSFSLSGFLLAKTSPLSPHHPYDCPIHSSREPVQTGDAWTEIIKIVYLCGEEEWLLLPCIDSQGLNHIAGKNQYPLLLLPSETVAMGQSLNHVQNQLAKVKALTDLPTPSSHNNLQHFFLLCQLLLVIYQQLLDHHLNSPFSDSSLFRESLWTADPWQASWAPTSSRFTFHLLGPNLSALVQTLPRCINERFGGPAYRDSLCYLAQNNVLLCPMPISPWCNIYVDWIIGFPTCNGWTYHLNHWQALKDALPKCLSLKMT